MSEDIQSKLDSLDKLKELCDYTEKQMSGEQNDDNLVKFLETEYPKISKAVVKVILKSVSGKKDSSKLSADEKKTLENQLIGNCYINDVNPMDTKTGKFVGFTKLKHKIAQRKLSVKK
ncbi:MAG: hypothetical protein NTW78_06165 [Campylobacterales bacterium]|nr:hypothetical protein [Campylobacterales bacterium]